MDMLSKEDAQDQVRTARVTVLGGDTKEIPLVQGQIVGHFLNAANVTVEDDQGITLNGQPTTVDTPVECDDDRQVVIVVASRPTLG